MPHLWAWRNLERLSVEFLAQGKENRFSEWGRKTSWLYLGNQWSGAKRHCLSRRKNKHGSQSSHKSLFLLFHFQNSNLVCIQRSKQIGVGRCCYVNRISTRLWNFQLVHFARSKNKKNIVPLHIHDLENLRW